MSHPTRRLLSEMAHLDLHFLNVGHGDCTFIDPPSGRLTMIDVNNSKSLPAGDPEALAEHDKLSLDAFFKRSFWSWSQTTPEEQYRSRLADPYKYYRKHFTGREIFRYIQTHPDLDHMTGLWGFFWHDRIELRNVWDVQNNKSFARADFDGTRYDWNDWTTYCELRRGRRSGKKHKVHPYAGDEGLWTEDGLSILSPTRQLVDYCNEREDWNNASFILSVDFGGRRVILPGDAEKVAWDSVESRYEADQLGCDVLKASHHGRRSDYSKSAVTTMAPSLVVCSVGKKPETDASAKYKHHGAQVFSTRYRGNMRLRIWDSGKAELTDRNGSVIGKLPRLRAPSWW